MKLNTMKNEQTAINPLQQTRQQQFKVSRFSLFATVKHFPSELFFFVFFTVFIFLIILSFWPRKRQQQQPNGKWRIMKNGRCRRK